MHILELVRYFLLGVLLVLNIAILILSASIFSIAGRENIYRPIFVYLVFVSTFTTVFLVPVALVDLFRRGAFSSRVLFELTWLTLFWIMHLAGASALTAASPCDAISACNSTQQALMVFVWLAVSILLLHLATLLLSSLVHVNALPKIWSMDVRDVPWFDNMSKTATPSPSREPNQQPAPYQPPSATISQHERQGRPQHGASLHSRSQEERRSWRSRFTSESFSRSRNQANMEVVPQLPLRNPTAYPFRGAGEQTGNQTITQPLPVTFTLERANFSRQASRHAAVRPLPSTTVTNGRIPNENIFYSNASAPPQSVSRKRQPGSRDLHITIPSNQVSSSVTVVPAQRQQQPTLRVERDTRPPKNSLLFYAPETSASFPTPVPQSRGKPVNTVSPRSVRPLPVPNSSAFYGAHIQSVLQHEDNMEDDGSPSIHSGRRVFASAPKTKPLSDAQAYALRTIMADGQGQASGSGSGRR